MLYKRCFQERQLSLPSPHFSIAFANDASSAAISGFAITLASISASTPSGTFTTFPSIAFPAALRIPCFNQKIPAHLSNVHRNFTFQFRLSQLVFLTKKRRPPAITADSRKEKARAYAQAHQVSSVFNYLLSTSILNGLK